MVNLYTQAEANIRKTWLYLGGFLLLFAAVGYAISYVYSEPLIFWVALIGSSIAAFISYWKSDQIVLGINKAKPIIKSDNPELYRLVENLCITAGLPLPKIYIMEESQPNAFATGRDPQHSVIVVTRGLLEKLERVELEGVISHELAHIGNRDILLATIAIVLAGTIIRITNFFFRFGFRGGRRSNNNEGGGQLKAILSIVAIVLVILAPVFATLMRMAISRKREFLADASGALLTRYPDGLVSALEKISADPNNLRVANTATAHLFIASPFRGEDNISWWQKLFLTHPPIGERIKALRGIQV